MSHQGITAGAHQDGVYHDSHALEGGEVVGALAKTITFDRYNNYLFVESDAVNVYDLNDGSYQFNLSRMPHYANFSGSTYIHVQYIQAVIPAYNYYHFRMFDYSGGASIDDFRTDEFIPETYTYAGNVYSRQGRKGDYYHYLKSTLYIISYYQYSPTGSSRLYLALKFEIPLTSGGFGAEATAIVFDGLDVSRTIRRGYNVSNGYFNMHRFISPSEHDHHFFADYEQFYERVFEVGVGFWEYIHSKDLAYSSDYSYQIATTRSLNIQTGVMKIIPVGLANPLGYIYRIADNVHIPSYYPHSLAADSNLTHPTFLGKSGEEFTYKSYINGVWTNFGGTGAGESFFESGGYHYTIYIGAGVQKIKRLSVDLATLEDFITL